MVAKKKPVAEEKKLAKVIAAFDGEKGVSLGRMFGSPGLKVNGKVFAMFVKGRFVAKLPSERVQTLIAAGGAESFDPGHGRPMKEWVILSDGKARWVALAKEAHAFVGGKS